MKTLLLAAMLALSAGAAFADPNKAVDSSNFQFGFASREVRSSDSPNNGTLGGNFEAVFPISSYFGASFNADFGRSETNVRHELEQASGGTTSGNTTQSCNVDNYDLGATVFWRNPKLGRVGAGYNDGHLSSDCGDHAIFLPSGDDTLGTKSYNLFAEYYWHKFTFGAMHTETKLGDGDTLKSTSLSGSWYPLENLRVGLTANDLYSKMGYGFVIENQPEFLGNGFSVSLGYGMRDLSPSVRTLNFNLVYHFGKLVPLIRRDREYR
jgi:hypothetical protein